MAPWKRTSHCVDQVYSSIYQAHTRCRSSYWKLAVYIHCRLLRCRIGRVPYCRCSTISFCINLCNNLVSWSSKRQNTVSRSSAVVEYRAIAPVIAECCLLRKLLQDLHRHIAYVTIVYCDNINVIYLSSNLVRHEGTKHIDIDIHFIGEVVLGHICVLHVLSVHQFADIMTKGLPVQFSDFSVQSLRLETFWCYCGCKPMDAENCEAFTDVYWIKFSQVNNARFAKRKLDEFVFLGNPLKVSYAPEFETLHDAKEKLEGRRREVMGRVKAGRTQTGYSNPSTFNQQWPAHKSSVEHGLQSEINSQDHQRSSQTLQGVYPLTDHVSSNKEYFASPSMNQSVQLVRNKLDMLQSIGENVAVPAAKKPRVDMRRRI